MPIYDKNKDEKFLAAFSLAWSIGLRYTPNEGYAIERKASAMTPEEFRAIRTKAGLSLDGLARVLRIADKASVHRWEKGQRAISGPVTILMEQIAADELPARYLARPIGQ